MYLKTIFFIGIASISLASSLRQLFPDSQREYVYALRTKLFTSSNDQTSSIWELKSNLHIYVYDNFTRARFKLHNFESTTDYSGNVKGTTVSTAMEIPWELEYRTVMIKQMYVGEEPEWSLNIKRAISINFQLIKDIGLYSASEPCLDETCYTVYVGNGDRILKYTILRNPTQDSRNRSKTNDWIKRSNGKDQIVSTLRLYDLNENNELRNLSLQGNHQYKTDDQILIVRTDMSLALINRDSSKLSTDLEVIPNLTKTSVQYASSEFNMNNAHKADKDIVSNVAQMFHALKRNETWDGFDIDNIHFMNLMMSTSNLELDSLTRLVNELSGSNDKFQLTNIFLQLLIQSRNAALPAFIKYLIFNKESNLEQSALLFTIMRLPFKITFTSKKLLEDFEFLKDLGTAIPTALRHAGILTFATLSQKAMQTSEIEQSYFDEIAEKYFIKYNDSLIYSDRLIWLQGLCNLGLAANSYTRSIFIDISRDRHERLWAGLNGNESSATSDMIAETALRILINDTEHIQLRILALHLVLSSVTDKNTVFMFVHNYVLNCENKQLRNFWFSSLRSLDINKNYQGYKNVSHLVSFVIDQISNPDRMLSSTCNHIFSAGENASLQMITIGNSEGNFPEFVGVKVYTTGRAPYRVDIYILLEGIPDDVHKRIKDLKAPLLSLMETVIHLLKTLTNLKFHVDIVAKVQGNTIFATHIDQMTIDSGSMDALQHLEKIVDENYMNNQNVYDYYETNDYTVSDLGTPINLRSNILTIAAIENKLRNVNEDWTWTNHVHIRYKTVTWTSLSAADPIISKELEVHQSKSVQGDVDFKSKLSLQSITLSNFSYSYHVKNVE